MLLLLLLSITSHVTSNRHVYVCTSICLSLYLCRCLCVYNQNLAIGTRLLVTLLIKSLATFRRLLKAQFFSWPECPDVKNYKWRTVWHRMLFNCTHRPMATVGVKGLILTLAGPCTNCSVPSFNAIMSIVVITLIDSWTWIHWRRLAVWIWSTRYRVINDRHWTPSVFEYVAIPICYR